MQRRVQAATADYELKVQVANGLRQELVTQLRPQAVTVVREMVRECDAGLTAHLQKYGKLAPKITKKKTKNEKNSNNQ